MPLKSSLQSRHLKLKQPIHPVVQIALDKLQGGGGGRAYSIEAKDLGIVRAAVAELEGSDELRTAMKGLLELGFFLATCQSSPTAGHGLAEIARDIARTLTPHPAAVAPKAAKAKVAQKRVPAPMPMQRELSSAG